MDAVTDIGHLLEGGVQLIEHKDGDGSLADGVFIVALTDDMIVGCLEGEDLLRLLVLRDGEVVFGESLGYGVALGVEDGDVEEDQARGDVEGGNIGVRRLA